MHAAARAGDVQRLREIFNQYGTTVYHQDNNAVDVQPHQLSLVVEDCTVVNRKNSRGLTPLFWVRWDPASLACLASSGHIYAVLTFVKRDMQY